MVYSKHFDNMADFVEFAEGINSSNSAYYGGSISLDFYGATWKQAKDMLYHGHKAGVTKISKMVDRLEHDETCQNTNYLWDNEGLFFDVATMLTGEPEHWLNPGEEPDRKVFKLFVNIGHLEAATTTAIKNRGAAIIALIDKLQQSPENIVELTVMSFASNVDRSAEVKITIDMGTTPLDMDAVAFVVAHPAFFRRLIFASREMVLGRKVPYSIGATKELPKSERKGLIYFEGGSKNFVRKNNETFATLESSEKWINEQIEKLTNKKEVE